MNDETIVMLSQLRAKITWMSGLAYQANNWHSIQLGNGEMARDAYFHDEWLALRTDQIETLAKEAEAILLYLLGKDVSASERVEFGRISSMVEASR